MKLSAVYTLVLTLCFATVAWANTEQVRFVPKLSASTERHIDSLDLSLSDNSIVSTVKPSFSIQSQTYNLNGLAVDGTMYEVRLCWPASSPLDVSLTYDEDVNTVTVSYVSEYYSSEADLNETPLEAQFEVILNKVVLHALPKDIFSAVALAIAGALGGYFLGGPVYELLMERGTDHESKNK